VEGRAQAPGGWRRALAGFLIGVAAGALVALAYTLLGGTPIPSNANSITRNGGARWFLPSEDEWYKAAYHKNDGVTGNYWDYPTSTDAVPFSDQPPGSDAPDLSNTANFFKDDGIANGYDDGFAVTVSLVEELGSDAYCYGTLDGCDRALGDVDVIARLNPRDLPRKGDRIHLRIRPGETHVFSARTGARLDD
jgi:hypothetical protein